jgi:hypothetical protein
MKRILLILDGTDRLEPALMEAKELCTTDDKLTVLAVAETPAREVLDTQRPGGPVPQPQPYAPVAGDVGARSAPDVPIIESEDDVARRAAGELRDTLDAKIGGSANGIEVWTQAIVRDKPAEAVADYVRQSGFAEVAVPEGSLDRLHELLTDDDGQDALDGSLAPVVVLPA